MKKEIRLSNGNVGYIENGKTYEVVVLNNGLGGDKIKHVVEVNSDAWYHLKCIEVPQKIAVRQKIKGTNKHFEPTDLESYLTEEAYAIYLKYDREKYLYFEAWLRKTLALKTVSFFRDNMIDKLTDYAVSNSSDGEDEGEVDNLSAIADIDVWAEVESDLEIEYILSDLDEEESYVAKRLLEGFNSSEIARELKTYKEKTRRIVRKICDKHNLKAKKDRVTNPNSHLKATTPREVIERVKRYERYVRDLNQNNKDLHQTIIDWARE